jgi:hypothetical protein
VGHSGALVAQDRGSEAVWAIVDGGQEWRRESGERLSSGGKVAVEKESLRMLSRSGSSCWACLKAKRGTTHTSWSWQCRRGAWLLGRWRRNVGRVGAGQREAGKAAARRGRTRGMPQSGSGVVGARHMAGKSGGGASGRATEEEEGR